MPTLLGAMANNTKSESGASGLLGALDRDHDGSILDDITGFINQGDSAQGDGILKHVLGGQRTVVESGLSQKTGLNSSQMSGLLKMVAPILMGYLGKQKKSQSSGFDNGSITDLLGGLASESHKNTSLDLGDVIDIVGGLTGGGSSKKSSGGLGGMLGKLFGS